MNQIRLYKKKLQLILWKFLFINKPIFDKHESELWILVNFVLKIPKRYFEIYVQLLRIDLE